jgi:hypothetical protein
MDKRKFQTHAPDLLQRLKMKTVVKKSPSRLSPQKIQIAPVVIKSPSKRQVLPPAPIKSPSKQQIALRSPQSNVIKSPSRQQPVLIKSPSRHSSPKKVVVQPSPSRMQIKSILKSPKRK